MTLWRKIIAPKQPNQIQERLCVMIFVLALLIVVVTILWQSNVQPRFISFAFTDRIFATGVVEDLSFITLWQRIAYFIILELSTVFGLLAVFFGLRWCFLGLTKEYIAPKPLRALRQCGFWLFFSMVWGMCMPAMIRPLLSWYNPSGLALPKLYLNSAELFLGVCGLGFWILGFVLCEALRLKTENEAFV